MGVIDGKTICQVALVVKDLEKTTEEYAKLFGVRKTFRRSEAGDIPGSRGIRGTHTIQGDAQQNKSKTCGI